MRERGPGYPEGFPRLQWQAEQSGGRGSVAGMSLGAPPAPHLCVELGSDCYAGLGSSCLQRFWLCISGFISFSSHRQHYLPSRCHAGALGLFGLPRAVASLPSWGREHPFPSASNCRLGEGLPRTPGLWGGLRAAPTARN